MLNNILAAAMRYITSNLSIIPIRADGSKSPALAEWKAFQRRRPTEAEAHKWFHRNLGIALVCGAISGNVEVIDFDDHEAFLLWLELLDEHKPGLIEKLVLVETPRGGRHVIYQCCVVDGSKKVANRLMEVPEGTSGARLRDGKWTKIKTLIETKGEGGYIVVAPSPAAVHPSGKRYRLLVGDYCRIPEIGIEERALLLGLAASLNEYKEAEWRPVIRIKNDSSIPRPGDDFNRRGDWNSLLTSHGWRLVTEHGATDYWKGPHNSDNRHSATVNFKDSNLLYVFSTSTVFEPGRGYSLFSAYAILEHNGDYRAAARSLAAQGYGEGCTRVRAVEPPVPKAASRPAETQRLDNPCRPAETLRLPPPERPSVTTQLKQKAGQ